MAVVDIRVEYCGPWGYRPRYEELARLICEAVPDAKVEGKVGRPCKSKTTKFVSDFFSKVDGLFFHVNFITRCRFFRDQSQRFRDSLEAENDEMARPRRSYRNHPGRCLRHGTESCQEDPRGLHVLHDGESFWLKVLTPLQRFHFIPEWKNIRTPDYKNKLILIDSQWLVKTNGATFFFLEKLGNKFLLGQFWPCLSFVSLSVPSGMALGPDFWSCGSKLGPLYWCDMILCNDGRWS